MLPGVDTRVVPEDIGAGWLMGDLPNPAAGLWHDVDAQEAILEGDEAKAVKGPARTQIEFHVSIDLSQQIVRLTGARGNWRGDEAQFADNMYVIPRFEMFVA
jgi:hypothetical protein